MTLRVGTRDGVVEGGEDAGLRVFLGIPYAEPPVGRLRWRPPARPAPWSGVRTATAFGPSAPQPALSIEKLMPGFDVGPQSEDCLYLNVYTPGCDGARRPVMVWIHGGAFTLGSASQRMYDWRRVAREGDLVVVTLNYRLGALAFTHLAGLEPGLGTSACAGILDQVAALEWVRDNVEAFGGDAGAVTIFGESAGGMSVGTLLGMPAGQGLFRGAIPMSGAAHSVHDAEHGCEVAGLLLDELGIPRAQIERAWEASSADVLAAQARVEARLRDGTHSRPFRPVIDGSALPEAPLAAISRGLSRDVRVMVGACRDEEKLFGMWDRGARELDDAGLRKRVDVATGGRGGELIEAYREARSARGADTSPFELYCAIASDLYFRVPATRLADAHSAEQPDTWSYLVTWEAQAMDGALGACHGVDLPFVQGAIGTQAAGLFAGSGPEAERLSREMMGAWIAFARHGDPRHPDLPDWPRHAPPRRATQLFGRSSEVVDSPLERERAAWDGIL